VKQRVQDELKAREIAERQAEAKYRVDAEERARASAAERRQQIEDDERDTAAVKPRRPVAWPKAIAIGVVVLLVAAVALVQVMPLSAYVPAVEALLTERLQQPVDVSNVRYTLFPTPQLTLERVSIGKLQEIKIETVTVPAMPMALFADTKSFRSVEASGIAVERDMVPQLAALLKAREGSQRLSIDRVRLKGVKLAIKDVEVPVFNGDLAFGRGGVLQKAVLTDGKLKAEIVPNERGAAVTIEGRGWHMPWGPAIDFDDLTLTAVIEGNQARVTKFDAKAGGGSMNGTFKAGWGNGVRVDGEFSMVNGRLNTLMPAFTNAFTASGTINAKGTVALQSTDLALVFEEPRVDATFNIANGELTNVDIVRALQGATSSGFRGGRTKFDDLSGTLQVAGKRMSYRQLRVASGPMNATGNVDVAPGSEISGRIQAELGSRGTIVARGALNVAGTVKDPLLKP
jgi:hypothetical protein